MATDENGELITGEMTNYKPTSVALVPWGANDRRWLTMRGMTQAEAEALRAQGVAAQPDEPTPTWVESLKQSLTKGIQDALAPLKNILSAKGSTDMADEANATDTTATQADAMISEADWAKIGQMIDEKAAAILADCKAACQEMIDAHHTQMEGSATTTENKGAEAPAAPPVATQENKGADAIAALTALVSKMAEQQAADRAETQNTLRSLLNNVPGGNAQTGGAVQTEATKSAWKGSGLAHTLASIPVG